jgi:ATP-binding cassette subfamily F protein 3
MIKVTNLSKSYGTQILFDDVSFNINPKEKIGLVGRNGHGKTTLFRLILGIEKPDSGTISIPKNYLIGYLDQHIKFSQDTILSEACLGLPEGDEHEHWKAEKILAGLGFSQNDMERHPSEFSGGFQVRLNLAKVLVSNPDLLLLDEPTNYLDIVSIRWLIKFLKSWKNELVVITHDRSFMDAVTTHTLGIHRKKIKKIEGGTEKYYNQILQEEEIYEKTRINDEKRTKELELFIRRFRAKARLANLVQSRIKTLAKKEKFEKLEKIQTLDFSFNSAPFPTKLMMEVRDVSFSYNKNIPYLINKFSIDINKNDRIGVIGKNGKGKSTLLRIIANELAPLNGSIKSHPLLKTGYFGQTNIDRLNFDKTIEEEIISSDPDCTQQKARNIAGVLMFSNDNALKKIFVLSGGEKSRVLLGKILATQCNLLLLDEPTNHLDMESCDSLIGAIDNFDGAVIIVTHNEMYLHTLVNKLVVFDRGKVFVYEGSYQNFLDDVGWEDDEITAQIEKNEKIQSTEEIDRKVLKKLKAEILKQKSDILKPLQSELNRIEKTIEKLEEVFSKNNQLIIEASVNGDGQMITVLSKENHQIKSQLDKFYEELDKLTQIYETESKKFEEKLNTLNPQGEVLKIP